MNEKGLQIGLYIVSAMSILTGFVTLPSGGIVAVVSGIGGIILTVLLSKRTKELNKTINDKDYEIQCLNNSVVNNTTELVALKRHQEELGFTTYDETKAAADTLQKLIDSYNQTIEKLRDSILEQTELSEKAEKRLKTAQNKLNRISELSVIPSGNSATARMLSLSRLICSNSMTCFRPSPSSCTALMSRIFARLSEQMISRLNRSCRHMRRDTPQRPIKLYTDLWS